MGQTLDNCRAEIKRRFGFQTACEPPIDEPIDQAKVRVEKSKIA
jgi:hypothetical protein